MTETRSLNLALVPLDERPVNTRYPQMLGAIAGIRILLPPLEVRGSRRAPADGEAVASWLTKCTAKEGVDGMDGMDGVDGVIASADYLAYGNLINARISDTSVTDVLPRLKPLETLAASGKPVFAFGLITRVSNADDSVEEPLYWSDYGTRFYRFSGLLHKREAGALEPGDRETLAQLEQELPAERVSDWLRRRLRNHTVNLALLDLLARDRLSFLLLTSDDTSPYGLPTREKVWLESWLRLLGPSLESRLLVHPGADEVGSALVARMVCQQRQARPTICPLYAVAGGEEIIAPYEDRPVRLTVEGQIRACGGQLTPDPESADILLAVLPPSPVRKEFQEALRASEQDTRAPLYRDFFARLARWQSEGRVVALADVTYPNGSDPIALEVLFSSECPLRPGELAAYGAWNTAGNTLGTVVAQAVCSLFIGDDPERQQAQQLFLTHRFLEDYGYQAVVRREAREKNQTAYNRRDPDPENQEQLDATVAAIEAGLARVLREELQPSGIGVGISLVPGSVRLPWRRTFEADFDLR